MMTAFVFPGQGAQQVGMGRALAEQGVHTVIPEFFADLAITNTNRADALIDRYGAGRPVVLAGHSLGGVMAADYTAAHRDTVRGLVLPSQPTMFASIWSMRQPGWPSWS